MTAFSGPGKDTESVGSVLMEQSGNLQIGLFNRHSPFCPMRSPAFSVKTPVGETDGLETTVSVVGDDVWTLAAMSADNLVAS